jgi:hypothetical protein
MTSSSAGVVLDRFAFMPVTLRIIVGAAIVPAADLWLRPRSIADFDPGIGRNPVPVSHP